MEGKHIIEVEMVDNFAHMLMSEDEGDSLLAMEILDNRDKTSIKSEEQYHRLMTLIVKDEELFPNKPLYVIKINGRVLNVNRKAIFHSEAEAKKWLSLHLTSKIGSHPKSLPNRRHVTPYIKAIKKIFKTGIEMRNFLVKNNLVEIINIS